MASLLAGSGKAPSGKLELFRVSTSSLDFKHLFCRSYNAMTASGYSVKRENYRSILIEDILASETPDEIYKRLCVAYEEGLVKYKICVSDIILIKREDTCAFYVDSSGFIDVSSMFTLEQQ